MDYLKEYLDNDMKEYAQVNVRVPVACKAQVLAYAADLRSAQLVAMAESGSPDVLYNMSGKNLPTVPTAVTINDIRANYQGDDKRARDLLWEAHESLMTYQRHVGILQTTREDSDKYMESHAMAVAHGARAMALLGVYKQEFGDE